MGAIICCCMSEPSEKKSLEGKLEKKIAEMRSNKSGQRRLKSIDSIVMLFPMFKERLKTLRGMFEQYGKFQKTTQTNISFLYNPNFDRKLTCFYVVSFIDEDSNGSIEPNELKRFLEHLQLHLQEKEIENIFHYCDIDGSKGIQFNEFIVLLCLIHLLAEPLPSDKVLISNSISCFLEIDLEIDIYMLKMCNITMTLIMTATYYFVFSHQWQS